jgi:hypothetical protein
MLNFHPNRHGFALDFPLPFSRILTQRRGGAEEEKKFLCSSLRLCVSALIFFLYLLKVEADVESQPQQT